MTAFLLIWSPKKWPWPELPDVARRVAAGEAVADVWGCGFARGILPGDRVFLHRVAQEPKGIFGSGYVTRAPYEVPDASTKRGYRLCIDFVYDWLVDAHQAPVIAREQLRVHPFSVQTWDAQSSGTIIKPIAEGALEKRWAELTGKRKPPKLSPPASAPRSTKVAAHTAAAQKSAARLAAAGTKPATSATHAPVEPPKKRAAGGKIAPSKPAPDESRTHRASARKTASKAPPKN
ncbi:hypothetical protein LJ656_21395 [Paraburkholderia sp. MMS20-SJTR3]|uniref:EVE domain-containing protein n=1 Tax=Paraburkholderia sejongensis TaxID=2886946 RepID=A0ABS8JZ08_9BURK|nr:hypothetical protein [Paraburkholderia sp. MMS20-SJTR3]